MPVWWPAQLVEAGQEPSDLSRVDDGGYQDVEDEQRLGWRVV